MPCPSIETGIAQSARSRQHSRLQCRRRSEFRSGVGGTVQYGKKRSRLVLFRNISQRWRSLLVRVGQGQGMARSGLLCSCFLEPRREPLISPTPSVHQQQKHQHLESAGDECSVLVAHYQFSTLCCICTLRAREEVSGTSAESGAAQLTSQSPSSSHRGHNHDDHELAEPIPPRRCDHSHPLAIFTLVSALYRPRRCPPPCMVHP